MMLRSVPLGTSEAALDASSTTTSAGVSIRAAGTVGTPGTVGTKGADPTAADRPSAPAGLERSSTCALRVGGSSHIRSVPAPTVATPTATRAAVIDHVVATSTASAGASMKVSSVHTESRANAVRCSSSGTSTASDCRTTEKTGTMNRPAKAAAPTSAAYPRNGAVVQTAASITTDGASARHRPSGPTTCSVTTTPSDAWGTRATNATRTRRSTAGRSRRRRYGSKDMGGSSQRRALVRALIPGSRPSGRPPGAQRPARHEPCKLSWSA